MEKIITNYVEPEPEPKKEEKPVEILFFTTRCCKCCKLPLPTTRSTLERRMRSKCKALEEDHKKRYK